MTLYAQALLLDFHNAWTEAREPFEPWRFYAVRRGRAARETVRCIRRLARAR